MPAEIRISTICGAARLGTQIMANRMLLLADREIYFKTIAILRLLNPRAHIPATTAFDAMAAGSRDRLLKLGANVIMPNLTPARYRRLYLLYPNKPFVDEGAARCGASLRRRLRALKRPIGTDFGHGWSTKTKKHFRKNEKNGKKQTLAATRKKA